MTTAARPPDLQGTGQFRSTPTRWPGVGSGTLTDPERGLPGCTGGWGGGARGEGRDADEHGAHHTRFHA